MGNTLNFGSANRDIYLLKTDKNGTLLWSKIIGWPGDDEGHSVRQTWDGGYIICGQAYLNGNGACLIKTDAYGDVTWAKKYDDATGTGYGEFGFYAEQTSDSGFIMVGHAENSFCSGGSDMYLSKTDASGNIQWNKLYGGIDHDFAYSVKQTTDGGYIMAGYTLSFGAGNEDICLVKTDSNGDTLWCKTYGGSLRDYCYSVAQTSDNGYLLTGYSESFGAGGNDYYLIKVNDSGNLQWSKTFGANSDERAYEGRQTTDGGYVVAGLTDGFGLDATSFYIVKTDSMGNSGCHQGNAITTTGNCPFNITIPTTAAVLGGTYSNAATLISTGGADSVICTTITTGISGINNSNAVTINPNPFSAHITLTGVSEKGNLEIFDITGIRILETKSQTDRITIKTATLPAGLYFIHYTEGTKSINTKVIKF